MNMSQCLDVVKPNRDVVEQFALNPQEPSSYLGTALTAVISDRKMTLLPADCLLALAAT